MAETNFDSHPLKLPIQRYLYIIIFEEPYKGEKGYPVVTVQRISQICKYLKYHDASNC